VRFVIPSEWEFSGFNEIQRPRKKCVLISYEALMNLAGYQNYDAFRKAHRKWVEAELEKFGSRRQSHWTQSIAVGSRSFIEAVQEQLSFRARGRRKRNLENGMALREATASYDVPFGLENSDIDGNL
jgi:putative transposase